MSGATPIQKPIQPVVSRPIQKAGLVSIDASQRAQGQILQGISEQEKQIPRLPQYPATQPAPTYAAAEPLQAFGSFASALAVFGSLLTRRPLISALNASAGAMNAIKQNDMITYKQKYEQWQQSVAQAQQQYKNEQQQYDEVIKSNN